MRNEIQHLFLLTGSRDTVISTCFTRFSATVDTSHALVVSLCSFIYEATLLNVKLFGSLLVCLTVLTVRVASLSGLLPSTFSFCHKCIVSHFRPEQNRLDMI